MKRINGIFKKTITALLTVLIMAVSISGLALADELITEEFTGDAIFTADYTEAVMEAETSEAAVLTQDTTSGKGGDDAA